MEKLIYEKENLLPIWDLETTQSLELTFQEAFKNYLKDETFCIEGTQNLQRIQITMTLNNKDLTLVYPIQCICVDYKEMGTLENVTHLILEYFSLYWDDYFINQRDTFVTMDWSNHVYKNITLYIRGYIKNLLLENMADDFLKKHGCTDLISSEVYY